METASWRVCVGDVVLAFTPPTAAHGSSFRVTRDQLTCAQRCVPCVDRRRTLPVLSARVHQRSQRWEAGAFFNLKKPWTFRKIKSWRENQNKLKKNLRAREPVPLPFPSGPAPHLPSSFTEIVRVCPLSPSFLWFVVSFNFQHVCRDTLRTPSPPALFFFFFLSDNPSPPASPPPPP